MKPKPALRSFGFAVPPLFLTPKKDISKYAGYVPPDITVGLGLITAIGSWVFGAGRFGTISRKITRSGLFAGVQYLFADTKVNPVFEGVLAQYVNKWSR